MVTGDIEIKKKTTLLGSKRKRGLNSKDINKNDISGSMYIYTLCLTHLRCAVYLKNFNKFKINESSEGTKFKKNGIRISWRVYILCLNRFMKCCAAVKQGVLRVQKY